MHGIRITWLLFVSAFARWYAFKFRHDLGIGLEDANDDLDGGAETVNLKYQDI